MKALLAVRQSSEQGFHVFERHMVSKEMGIQRPALASRHRETCPHLLCSFVAH